MNEPIFLPTLSHWEHGNQWSGERGLARFWITPEDGQLNAEMWQGPMSREFGQVERSGQFPISEEGLEALSAWLTEGAAIFNARNQEKQ